MKKLFTVLFLISIAVPVFSDNMKDMFLGEWETSLYLMEQQQGLLTAPGAEYSFPYRGITEINFLDSGMVSFMINNNIYRAFYDVQPGDFDNFHIICRLRNDEEFVLKLVKVNEAEYKFLYRIAAASIMNGSDSDTEESAEPEMQAEDSESIDEAGSSEGEQELFSNYIGIIRRK